MYDPIARTYDGVPVHDLINATLGRKQYEANAVVGDWYRLPEEWVEARKSPDVRAVEWLHRFIVGAGGVGDVSPLGRRWLINALGHLSDGLDNFMRGK